MTAINHIAQRPGKADSSIDLTPMLDVVFILLIFFVVTATFLRENTLPLAGQEPDRQTESITENAGLLIQISADNQIYLNQQRVDLAALKARIFQERAANPNISVIVRPHDQSVANVLIGVMDEARSAGAGQIQVVR